MSHPFLEVLLGMRWIGASGYGGLSPEGAVVAGYPLSISIVGIYFFFFFFWA